MRRRFIFTVKTNVRKRPYDAGGLGRQGAVRKRKEEVHEQNGHQFVQKQFYTVVMCALCGEFMLKGAGMQCEDCKYACHVKCYQKVVTKCISKSNADSVSLAVAVKGGAFRPRGQLEPSSCFSWWRLQEKDEEQINHRIPHRFEPITNISPNWCCHCGMVLPLGRKQARKCSGQCSDGFFFWLAAPDVRVVQNPIAASPRTPTAFIWFPISAACRC